MPVPSSSSSAETEKSDTEVDNNNKVEDLTDGIFKKGTKDAGLVEGMKNALVTVKRLCLNWALVMLMLGGSAEMASSIIGRTFGVKYLISQFSTSPKDATILTGGILIPCVTVGQVVSAFICRRFKLNTRGCVIFILISLCLSVVTVPIKMFIGCPTPPTAGVNVPYAAAVDSPDFYGAGNSSPEMIDFKQQSSNHNLEATCNANCQCPREIFRPVCGVNGVTYISPCHAGCQTLVKSNSTSISNTKPSGYFTKKVYSDCACVAGSDGGGRDSATSGQCRSNCDYAKKLTVYMVLAAFSVFFMSLTHNPITFITLRIVDSSDRSVAIGLKSLINKCLAFFPVPVYMGAIINRTCIHWQRTCGERGACWLYNLVTLRFAFFGTIFALQFIGILCYVVTYAIIMRTKKNNMQKLNDDSFEANETTKIELVAELSTKDEPTKC